MNPLQAHRLSTHQSVAKKLNQSYLASLTAATMLSMSLSACQTMPADTTNTTPTQSSPSQNKTPAGTKRPNLDSAHDLVSYAMLHRFDKSYDYQKSTHYQVDTLYQAKDIESSDNSVFLSLLSIFSGDTKFPKSRDILPEVEKCEQQYTQAYKAILDSQSNDLVNNSVQSTTLPPLLEPASSAAMTNDTPKDPKLASIQAAYEACLTAAETNANTTDATDGEFTSINSIIQSQSPDKSYQKSVRKLADYLNTIADNNSDSDTDKSEKSDKSDSSNDERSNDINDIDSPNALGVPPKKTLPKDDEASSDTDSVQNDDSSSSSDNDTDTESESRDSTPVSLVKKMRNLRITPEQIKVLNDAFLTPKTLQYQGSYNKSIGQLSSVLIESNDSKYNQSYKRVPMLMDFNEMSITLEPDAVLPMASFISDKELPENLAGKSVKFVLPQKLRQNIPLPVLKDTLFQAIANAYSDIDEEKFTETLNDDYGKSLHASRVVKINLTTQDMGFIVGRTLKYWSQSLSTIRQQHPEYIKNDSDFAATLDLLAAANRVYRAEDLAKLAQFVEAIVPVSYNSFNYYYFDRNNQLIGYRKIRDYRSSLLAAKGKSITTSHISYRSNDTTQPHLYYQPKAEDIIDGNALLERITGEKKLKSEAQDARFGYADVTDDSLENKENDDESEDTPEASASSEPSVVMASAPK